MPIVVMLSGPNGAGMPDTEETAFRAGRVMIERLEELEVRGANFAFETTLASKSFAPRIARLRSKDYFYALLYLWLPCWEDSVRRVRDRVRRGGHHVPDDIVKRRYHGGLRNFFGIYRPMADVWRFYDNSAASGPRLIASGVRNVEVVRDITLWPRVIREVDYDSKESN